MKSQSSRASEAGTSSMPVFLMIMLRLSLKF